MYVNNLDILILEVYFPPSFCCFAKEPSRLLTGKHLAHEVEGGITRSVTYCTNLQPPRRQCTKVL